ncbi:D-alanyl-D-alanine carboxypeptidase family protein [Paratissierella segnis]|uniref:D-alanyl-D-alanine carboxypeptidase n=1 Tax=Paratissierella segnis TaxID=2763679 RepID=A0A926IJH6_9FIRM|nr:serine hydrolase [Paratissierella segnis]MBC8586693.1 D-alanyl-D-alanine carboxypeptidase [Paratissierella segnis]
MKKIRKLIMVAFILVIILISKDNIVDLINPIIGDYESKYICVMDRENKAIIYEKNLKNKAYPASLTKIMTTIVALEHIEDLSAIAPIDIESYRDMVEQNSSMAGFFGKEQVTYRDLLYGTMLPSGGEAANSLAINVAGNIENFVEMMNEKAAELKLENTHFTSPEGFHDKDQYTTAYDMALLLDYALENGHFKVIFTTDSYETTKTLDYPDGIILESTVLSKLDETNQDGFTIIGGKSGTTYEAGQCWATLGIKDDHEYIVIVMGAPINDISNPDLKQRDDTIKLYSRIK